MRCRIMKLRIEAGYRSQAAFVRELDKLGAGITARRYRLIEQGKGKFTAAELAKIADALNIDVNVLLEKKNPH